MNDIFTRITELRAAGTLAALVTVIKTRGSAPRTAGTRMLVFPDGRTEGTVGGSSVEALITSEAIECLRAGKTAVSEHSLHDAQKEDTGMVCGGTMTFFIEPLTLPAHVYIFGGGHVAVPLARLLHLTGFQYTLIDDRAEFATNERFPDAREVIQADTGKYAEQARVTGSDFITIVTRCHDHDYEALRGVLGKPARYIGLIGSKAKRKQIFSRLRDDGFSDEQLETVHSPIGLDISAETPEEIAVSIVAELIACKNGKQER
jgi:xanthine dehydrogenase accessory factor